MRYFYATKSRSLNVDALLKKDFVMACRNEDVGGSKYYDLLIYDGKLKDEEVEEYELEYMGAFKEWHIINS